MPVFPYFLIILSDCEFWEKVGQMDIDDNNWETLIGGWSLSYVL